MIPRPSCNWCQALVCWGDDMMEDFSPLVFHLYAGLLPAGHPGVSGGWRPPDWPGGGILSVLEGNHLKERAALRWQVRKSLPLQVPLTLLSSFMCMCKFTSLVVQLKCDCFDSYTLRTVRQTLIINIQAEQFQEFFWTKYWILQIDFSFSWNHLYFISFISVLNINITTVERLLLTQEFLYAVKKKRA